MKSPSQMSRIAILVEGALMVALASVLSLIPFIQLPWGGSITLFATLPILVMSFRHNTRWGVATAVVYGFAQLLLGLQNIMYAKTLFAMVLSALLDYILAYAFLGFAGAIARRFKRPMLGIGAGVLSTGLLRLFCSFLSGVIVWREWAPAGTPVWVYSLTYNAGWALPDIAIVLVAALLLSRVSALHMRPEPAHSPA